MGDAIFNRIFGRQQEDRDSHSSVPESVEDLDAISSWQQDVEDDEIERLGAREKKAFFSRGRKRYIVVLDLKPLLQGFTDLRFVFDDQDSHGLC